VYAYVRPLQLALGDEFANRIARARHATRFRRDLLLVRTERVRPEAQDVLEIRAVRNESRFGCDVRAHLLRPDREDLGTHVRRRGAKLDAELACRLAHL